MHKYLKTGLVLGVHPVFGPGARDMTNHNFVLTPTSGEERSLAQRVRQYLETRGARVTLMTPQEHDEMMAVVLGLSHFIALVSADTLLGVDKLEQLRAVGGTTYKVLLALVESVVSEDPEFYASLQMNLPNVMEIEKLFQSNAKAWVDLVESKDSQKFAERMNALREGLEKVNPDFGKGYESMYKLVEGL
jgi:prephenate dehydrogenase